VVIGDQVIGSDNGQRRMGISRALLKMRALFGDRISIPISEVLVSLCLCGIPNVGVILFCTFVK
jgi:hypothetical protein